MNKPTYEYYPLTRLGSAVIVLLIIKMTLILVGIGFDFMDIRLMQRGLAGEELPLSELDASDTRLRLFSMVWLGFALVLTIVFLKWFYRASANANVYSAADMSFSAGWSVGWFYVPIMNLFRPYQAMKDTWKVSAAGPKDDPSFDVPIPAILPLWWTLWIISIISAQISTFSSRLAATYESYLTASYVSAADYGIGLCLCLVTLKIVNDLTRIQTERGAPDESTPCPVCGERILSTSSSCPMCGARLAESSSHLDDTNPFGN